MHEFKVIAGLSPPFQLCEDGLLTWSLGRESPIRVVSVKRAGPIMLRLKNDALSEGGSGSSVIFR